MRNFQTKFVGKIKTRILWPIYFFFEDRAFYEVMWKNILEPGRPQLTIWGKCIAFWVTKGTNTRSEYILLVVIIIIIIIIIILLLQQWLHNRARASVLFSIRSVHLRLSVIRIPLA
jgi:hypothetical protein